MRLNEFVFYHCFQLKSLSQKKVIEYLARCLVLFTMNSKENFSSSESLHKEYRNRRSFTQRT
jgi:hypothetical protein